MIIELTKNIKVIRPEGKAVFPYSNSVYVDDKVKTVIDAGAGTKAYNDIPVDEINLLLLSHHHFDHVHCAGIFKNAAIYAGREDAPSYSDFNVYLKNSGFTDWEELMGEPKTQSFTSTVEMPPDVPAKHGFQEIKLDGLIEDGTVFDLGNTSVKAIHTPGHTHGHYVFYFEKEDILFSGDIDISPRGPWYGGGCCDLDLFVESIKKVMEINPRVMVTSHRRVFYSRNDDIVKLLQKYLGVVLKKEENIIAYLSKPRTIDEIARQEFIDQVKPEKRSVYENFWNKMMIKRHLERLEKTGRIRKLDKENYLSL